MRPFITSVAYKDFFLPLSRKICSLFLHPLLGEKYFELRDVAVPFELHISQAPTDALHFLPLVFYPVRVCAAAGR